MLHWTALPEGAKAPMFLAVAVRDPCPWQSPNWFDITRNTARHIGFGAGTPM